MRTKLITGLAAAAFFCTQGWVYSTKALGADETAAPDQAAPVIEESTTPPSVFAEEQVAPEPEAVPAEQADLNAQAVKVSTFGTIDLHVKDLDLAKVLQLLSIQSQRNIVASRNVSGSVTADLYDVDFYEALDAILHTNGLGYVEKGNFIHVYTADEIKAIQEASRKAVTRVHRLNYLTATDASTFVTPLLSGSGSIAVSGDVAQGYQPSVSDGGAKTFANPDTLIIRDFQENVDEIVAVLTDLDQRPKQVLIEATVLQAKLNEDNAFGVDLSVVGSLGIDAFTDPFDVVDGLEDALSGDSGGAGQSSNIISNPNPTARVGIVTNHISAMIEALDSVTDTTVLANPKILVLNRQRADILIGEKLGYLSTQQSDTSTTQTVEFLEVGTQLTVRPFISDDGMVRMELRPSISDGEPTTVGDTVIPNTSNQELTTNIMVQSGQTVVLGGLFKDSTTVNRRQTPVLGDVPILGIAFRGQDDVVERDEVIFLVTPTIQKDQAMYAAGEEAEDQVELATLGARQALLPFSRSKLVASHMQNAIKSYEAGDTERALWSVNMATNLDPTNVEGQKLREKLTGQKLYWPNRSILKGAVDKMVEEHLKADAAVQPDQATAEVPIID